MQEPLVYEYAVIRVLPQVEREEFFNVGLVLFCKCRKYIRMAFLFDETKFSTFQSELTSEQVISNLQAFELISKGDSNAGRIAQEEPAERFRWLTAVRSSCIQTSRPHPGLSTNLDETFDKLFQELVS
ncbi:MAG TPA: DUF3037 domain-containing protein [Flavobacteriales bacterium]|nr:DUF3037 domain-containing protein [Flavobacteriales bacterium]